MASLQKKLILRALRLRRSRRAPYINLSRMRIRNNDEMDRFLDTKLPSWGSSPLDPKAHAMRVAPHAISSFLRANNERSEIMGFEESVHFLFLRKWAHAPPFPFKELTDKLDAEIPGWRNIN